MFYYLECMDDIVKLDEHTLGMHNHHHFTQDLLAGGSAYLLVEFSFKKYEIWVLSPIPKSASH